MLTEYTQRVVDRPSSVRAAYEAELQQILTSRTFRNTEVLKRLLEYLGQEALADEARELKEYTVGVEAFGKPPEYDPKLDSSVRVQAGKLRQKLEEYYRSEGVRDPFIIELPKGHFRLEFRERSRAAAPPAAASHRWRGSVPWAIAALAISWALVSTVFAVRNRAQEADSDRYSSPAIAAIWDPLLARRPAIVCLGTPLFAKVSGDFFRTPGLNNWTGAAQSEVLKIIEKDLHGRAIPAYPYTGVGEAWAAFEVARLFLSKHKDIHLLLSSALTWEDIGRNDVIFVGPPKYNLQESDLPVQQDFLIQHGRLENVHPKPGEPNAFTETWSPDQSSVVQGYALIARLPGLHGAGHIMLLAATSTEGTRAAVEYVTRAGYAAQLVYALRQEGGNMPKYFEAVVRARFRSQTPIQIEVVAVRTL